MEQWDYDKLFAIGNVIGVKSDKDIEVGVVDSFNQQDWGKLYGNNLLSTKDNKIKWIVSFNADGTIKERVFDRDKYIPVNPMPKLETGMIIELHSDEENHKGIVVNDKIIYSDYGFDYVEDFDEDSEDYEYNPYYCIVKIWDNNGYGFGKDYCSDNYLIWSKEEN